MFQYRYFPMVLPIYTLVYQPAFNAGGMLMALPALPCAGSWGGRIPTLPPGDRGGSCGSSHTYRLLTRRGECEGRLSVGRSNSETDWRDSVQTNKARHKEMEDADRSDTRRRRILGNDESLFFKHLVWFQLHLYFNVISGCRFFIRRRMHLRSKDTLRPDFWTWMSAKTRPWRSWGFRVKSVAPFFFYWLLQPTCGF